MAKSSIEPELYAAGSDLSADDTKVARTVAGGRIADYRVVANVRRFQAELDALALPEYDGQVRGASDPRNGDMTHYIS
jgi:hypothetical protein